MIHRHPFRFVAAALVVSTFGLAACGGSDDTTDATEAPAATEAPVVTDAPAATEAPVVTDAPAATEAPAATDAPAAGGAVLTIAEFAFSDLTVAAGTEITLTNDDGFTHTVTDEGDVFDVSVSGGSSEALTIDAAGTYSIVCKIHPSMKGTIVVE